MSKCKLNLEMQTDITRDKITKIGTNIIEIKITGKINIKTIKCKDK